MLKIYTASVHPDFMNSYMDFGVFRRCRQIGFEINNLNLRDFAVDSRGSVDSSPYSEEDGMVLRPEPLRDLVRYVQGEDNQRPYVVYTCAYGSVWSLDLAKRWSKILLESSLDFSRSLVEANKLVSTSKLLFICGRFSGIDQRFIDKYVDEIYSLGDFILSGGELVVLTMLDSILRFIPEALGNSQSCRSDSFEQSVDGLIEYPIYSRPQEFEGSRVPDVLLSGDHQKIKEWKKMMSLKLTQKYRPDLLNKKK